MSNTTKLRHRDPSLADRCMTAAKLECRKIRRAIDRNDGRAFALSQMDSRSYMSLHDKARLMGR